MNVHDKTIIGQTDTPSAAAKFRYPVVDVDIHPRWNSHKDLYPYLERRWQTFLEEYGTRYRHGVEKGTPYPGSQPEASRRDAWPEDGGRAGSDLALMQRQHLDPDNVELGVLTPMGPSGFLNPGLAAAYCRAVNDWQVETWTSKEPRLKASIVVPYDDAPAAVEEIERRAGDPNFVQVLLLARTAEPLGQKRYWPIYEAAVRHDLTVGIHSFGQGAYPYTANGWPSYYIEEMHAQSATAQAVVASLIFEGVFENNPGLRVLMTEAGVAWMTSFMWRLDKHWMRLKSETPHLKRLPSEYIRQQVWVSTQPIEEPDRREQLLETIDWMGWDRVCFASDYPHWDFDDPMHVMPLNKLSDEQRRLFLTDNAHRIFGTGGQVKQ
jgi:predicted TIM-barrel fold metal-dependent hydrolase